MILTIARSVWKNICIHIVSNSREMGGLLIGRTMKSGNIRVDHHLFLSPIFSTSQSVCYENDDVARSKICANAIWEPEEAVGGFHSHIYYAPSVTRLSDADKEFMLDCEIEMIVVVYPESKVKMKIGKKGYYISRTIGGFTCRGEAYLKTGKKVKRVEVRLG